MAAAMPPLFIYRKASGEVEQLPLMGMFLGTEIHLPYEETRFALDPGDKVLLVSDGYLEQVNSLDEMLDARRCRLAFKEEAGREALAPEEILARLSKRFHAWCDGALQVDDVTLVLIEARA